jgi:hypothetical protein
MNTVLHGYFISSGDMQLIEDTVKSLPRHLDIEDAIDEILEVIEDKTPIVVKFGGYDD